MSRMPLTEAKLSWRDWAPGLDHGDRVLGDVLSSMPAAAPGDIPWLIRLVENPTSPVALPGAITLQRHDAIHILLGRGMLPQDEAFVIGFTMGATKRLTYWQKKLFEFFSNRLYPRVYRFSEDDLVAFRLGVGGGWESRAKDLQDFPFEEHLDKSVDAVRGLTGISRARIRAFHAKEQRLLPHTFESKRLDPSPQLDPSDITKPEGAPLKAADREWWDARRAYLRSKRDQAAS